MTPILLRRTSGLACIVMAAGFLIIGLWPFSFRPVNKVSWLADRAGLHFEPDGIVYDTELLPADFPAGSPDQPAVFTMELWLEPALEPNTDVFHILTIDDGQLPSNFVLCQWKSFLLLRTPDNGNERGFREVGIDGLHERKTRFITVTGGPSGTAFYMDGTLVERFPGFVLPVGRLKGRLILGNAADGKHPWTGQVFGLAMFGRALDDAEVAQHYAAWTNNPAKELISRPALTALYLFDQRNGQWADDISSNRHRLFIPPRYHVLHKLVLALPQYDDWLSWSNLDDMAINILGFVPFGFCAWYFRRARMPGRKLGNILFAVFVGAGLSLLIELIQIWLPNRASQVTDLACNIGGTFLGVLLALFVHSRQRRSLAT